MLQRYAHRALWALACLLSLAITSMSAWAQSLPNVLTCASVAADTPLSPWPNCATAAYKPAGPGLIVAVQRGGVALWEPSSSVLLTDNVFTSAPYNGTTSDWWPAKSFVWSSSVTTGTVTFTWLAPTVNADGSTPVNPVASYELYEGTTAVNLAPYAAVPVPALTYTTAPLPAGVHYFALTSIGTNGAESPQSPVISTLVPVPVIKSVAPGAPTNVQIVQTTP